MTTNVPTSQLCTGDIVKTHGILLRLTTVITSEGGTVFSWSTEYADEPEKAIAEHGIYYGGVMEQNRWIIQGNASATWNVVSRLPETAQEG